MGNISNSRFSLKKEGYKMITEVKSKKGVVLSRILEIRSHSKPHLNTTG
jgi:hypothetical protein